MKTFLLQFLFIFYNISRTFSDSGLHFALFGSNGKTCSVKYIESEDNLKYPKNDRDLQRVKELWDAYYACLERKGYKDSKPEIRRLLEGQYTEFKCKICPRPFQNYDEIEWKYKPIFSDLNFFQFETLDLTPEMTLTRKKHLRMYNVQEDFGGLYVCYHGKYPVSAYILEVSKNDPIEQVHPYYTSSDQRYSLEVPYLEMYRKWSEWTECSACDRVGKRFKYGTCMVMIRRRQHRKSKAARNRIKKSLRKRQDVQSTATYPIEQMTQLTPMNRLQMYNFTETAPKDIDLARTMISAFHKGIPCMSPILPKFVSDMTENYKAVQAASLFCSVPCKKTEIFEVFDSYGRVIEVADNSAGIYSLLQKIPPLPPEIERRTLVVEFGKDIIIQCPGTILRNIPVTWKINKQIVFPELIANESSGRFTIDLDNRIHIKKLRLKDNHIYSCWQRDRLVGTVHLNVEKKFKICLNHHVMLGLAVSLVGVCLFIGVKLFKRELKLKRR